MTAASVPYCDNVLSDTTTPGVAIPNLRVPVCVMPPVVVGAAVKANSATVVADLRTLIPRYRYPDLVPLASESSMIPAPDVPSCCNAIVLKASPPAKSPFPNVRE